MSKPPSDERDYVLGTHDEEIERLGLQHRVWQPRSLRAWHRAGFSTGQTIMDVGCGPGYASLDLAGIVGPAGRVIAIDRSRRFLDALASCTPLPGSGKILTHELDLDTNPLPAVQVDGAWVRWVFAFVRNPRGLLERITAQLRPGAALVIHEYFDYATWRMIPRLPEMEAFVATVMKTWRDNGGEPDIALDLPGWLTELGYSGLELTPIVDAIPPSNFIWQWPTAFIDVNLRRQVELGIISPESAEVTRKAVAGAEARKGTYMVTPAVLEIIARRPA